MIYKDICIMLPTYKRVKNGRLIKCIESIYNTVSDHKRAKLCLCVNENDSETIDYVENILPNYPIDFDVVYEKTTQPNLAYYFNKMYDETVFNDEHTLVSMVGDDMVFKTEGWDIAILKEVNAHDGVGFVWANDDYIARERCPVNLFTTRKTVQATEKPFMCPLFRAEMIDVVWGNIGIIAGCGHFLADVIIKHEHCSGLPANLWDENFGRLSPLRQINNSNWSKKQATIWSMICASNLIKNGLCDWNMKEIFKGY